LRVMDVGLRIENEGLGLRVIEDDGCRIEDRR
jgi:hypothetical protein